MYYSSCPELKAMDDSVRAAGLPKGWQSGFTGTLDNIDMYYFNEETGEKVKSLHEARVRHVAARKGFKHQGVAGHAACGGRATAP